jgi:hypothetical protein
MLFSFRMVGAPPFSLDIPDDATVANVKSLIHSQFPYVNPSHLRLVHRSIYLPNSLLLSASNILPSDCITVLWRSLIPDPLPPFDHSLAPGIPAGASGIPAGASGIPAGASGIPAGASGIPAGAPDENLSALLSMGFDVDIAKRALDRANGKVDIAVDMLLNHPEMLQEAREPAPNSPTGRLAPENIARLERNPSMMQPFLEHVLDNASPDARQAIVESPEIFFHLLGLDPARFDLDVLRRALDGAIAQQRPGPVGRLRAEFQGLPYDIVAQVFRECGRDEGSARTKLQDLMGGAG